MGESLFSEEDFAVAWRIAQPEEPLAPLGKDALDDDLGRLLEKLARELDDAPQVERPLSLDTLQHVQELYLQYEQELRALESKLLQRVAADEPLLETTATELARCEGFFTDAEERLCQVLGQLDDRRRRLAFDEVESQRWNERVHTTREAAGHLQAFALEVVLPPALVRRLTARPQIDEVYLEEVKRFRSKLAFASLPDVQRTAAYKDLRPILHELQRRVVARLQAFLLGQMSRLEEPNTNIQILQQNMLLKYRYFIEFLQDVAPEAVESITQTYKNTQSRVYLNFFRQYLDGLWALHEPDQNLEDTLLIPPSMSSSLGAVWQRLLPTATSFRLPSMFTSSWMSNSKAATSTSGDRMRSAGTTAGSAAAGDRTAAGAATPSGLGQRLAVLEELAEPPLVLAVVQAEGRLIPPERIFWSVGRMLLTICSSERDFLADFFGPVESPTLEHVMLQARDYVAERFSEYFARTTDVVGLLLCTRIGQTQRDDARANGLALLEIFFSRVELAIIPRLKEILDANETSLAQADPRLLFEISAAAYSAEQDPETELARRIHAVVQRYADYVQILLTLALRVPSSDAMVLKSLHVQQREMHRILHGMAERFQTAQNRNAFLINQLGTIVQHLTRVASSVQRERDPVTDAGLETLQEMKREFELELEACTNQLAAMVLMGSFGEFLTLASSKAESSPRANAPSTEHWRLVLAEFRSEWKAQLELMCKAIVRSFPNWEIGASVLRRSFQELRRYNMNLQRLLPYDASSELGALLVDDAALVFEMRRYVKVGTAINAALVEEASD